MTHMVVVRKVSFFLFFLLFVLHISASSIKGTVTDKITKEPLIGATIQIYGTSTGVVTDVDGKFKLNNLKNGVYNLEINYISYKPLRVENLTVPENDVIALDIEMEPDDILLADVIVSARMRRNTETALLVAQKNSLLVQSGVSAQQISRTQDRNATEVIRRVPGISIIDDKFVIVRGLSQRYNNVWINNAAVPSTEADTRAFSFDIIPSSQLDNLLIIKSPAPELPADFSGGFIKIQTKDIPDSNSFSVQYGTGVNDNTHFKNFYYSKGGATDFLGFDNGFRGLKGIASRPMDNNNTDVVNQVTKSGFNNDWRVLKHKPFPDQKLNISYNRKYEGENNKEFAILSALNYSLTSRSVTNMENSRFGVYNVEQDVPEYNHKYTDNQYTTSAHIGAMLNLTFIPNGKDRYEFKNIFNQIGQDRYTERNGYQYISGMYVQEKHEYYYNSRTTYSGQFAGTHDRLNSKLDWELGYNFANRKQPDRRIYTREENGFVGDSHYGEMYVDQNDIERYFTKLSEHIMSAGLNYLYEFYLENINPVVKTGLYSEYRTRSYDNRFFYYLWNQKNMPVDFAYGDFLSDIMIPGNFGADKLFIYEDTDNRNSYDGNNRLIAGYLSANIPFGKLNIYTGVRYEHNVMTLKNYVSIRGDKKEEKEYTDNYFYPSVNLSYKLKDNRLIRLAYGTSVNRPEFREVSPSVYYDFDLFSSIKGNKELKTARIQNVDLRYEWYPSGGETVSVALFYKNFRNPIEWTYLDAGGSYTYTFENAHKADNYGIEVDIKKSLDFIGLPDFTWSFNGTLIESKVKFKEESLEKNRAMQGQSPYLVNTGLFYRNERSDWNIGLLYNRIGKRIVGVGRVDTSDGGTINNDIPDAYEMPRNMLDVSISKKIGKQVEIKASLRDLFNEDVVFKQYPRFYDVDNHLQEREQVTKRYKPGRNFGISVSWSL